MKITGIYKITSPDNRIYIGQSVDVFKRKSDYKCLHRCNEQPKLFNSFKKYGVNNHVFEIIHECSRLETNQLEIFYINLYDSCNNKTGLNTREGGINGKHSPDTIKKMSESQKIRPPASNETKEKMSLSKKGKPTWNKGLIGVQIAWNKGKKLTAEHIEKSRLGNTGRKDSKETKIKKSIAGKEKVFTEEHKMNLKIARSKRPPVSELSKEKMRISRLNFINNNNK